MLLAVVVPDGLGPGDTLTVETEEGHFDVIVPEGCYEGSTVEVDLPVLSADTAVADSLMPPRQEQQELEVVVPDGVRPGEPFTVQTACGDEFEVLVPEGCAPGQPIIVSLPTFTGRETPPPTSCPPTSLTPPPQALAEPPPPTCSGYKFGSGQRVEVLRSDGSYSVGTVMLGFEGVFEPMYQVRLDNGLYKQAVPEDELCELSYRPHSAESDDMLRELSMDLGCSTAADLDADRPRYD